MSKKLIIGEQPQYWQDACDFLANNDPVMNDLISGYGDLKLTRINPAFYTLCRSIAGQQISVQAADSIWLKLMNYIGGNENIRPEKIIEIDEDTFRSLGFSRTKHSYTMNIAEYFLANHSSGFEYHDYSKLEKELLAIKGVGRWTVDMFAMFHLHEPDILPLGDIGMLKAVKKLYGYENLDYKQVAPITEELAQKWKPYSTVATMFLWRSIDPVSVEY